MNFCFIDAVCEVGDPKPYTSCLCALGIVNECRGMTIMDQFEIAIHSNHENTIPLHQGDHNNRTLFGVDDALSVEDSTHRDISISSEAAYQFIRSHGALLVDIRTLEERRHGYPEHSHHIPWRIGPALLRNPRFQKSLKEVASPELPILLICRSGRRSLEAALELRKAGYHLAYDVSEGCDGEDGASGQSGWKTKSLPWISK